MSYKITAYGYKVMSAGPVEARAQMTARTRVGAWLLARRLRRGWPAFFRYERVEIRRVRP